jgi:hypothetical protein
LITYEGGVNRHVLHVLPAGMDKVRTQFEARAAELMERMSALSGKQEEMLEAQGQLGSELAVVGGKVSAVSEQVGFSNHAILLLCGALSEMAKRVGISNGKYVRELEHLSRSVATTGLPAGAMGANTLPAMMVSACGRKSASSLQLCRAVCFNQINALHLVSRSEGLSPSLAACFLVGDVGVAPGSSTTGRVEMLGRES